MAKADKSATGIDPEIEALKRRAAKLRADRGTLNSHLEEIAEYIYPNGMGFTGSRTSGEKRMTRVFDETGITANRLLAASLHSMATNPASKWFSIRCVKTKLNEAENVKVWRSNSEDDLYAEKYAPGTNIIPALHEFYLGLGAFGTSIMFIGENKRGGLMYQTRALAECYIAEDADSVVTDVFRIFSWTVRQAYDTWKDKCSKEICDAYEKGKYDDMVELCHAVYPRHGADPTKKNAKNMPFASCYFEMKTCNELEQGGFPEFPYVVARWEKAAGEIYGRSPGMEALPAVKMINAIEAEMIKVMQKIANPVRYLRDDGVIGSVRAIPGATNMWRGNPGEGIYLEPTPDKVPITLEWAEAIRNRIRTIFHNDTLQIVDDREMTLGEARMRRTERMRLQGPNIGRLDSEMLGPMIERDYGILSRQGKMPPAPEELDGEQITVEFVSPLANAQKQEQLAGLVQIFDYIAPLGEMGVAALAEEVNLSRMIRGLWDVMANDPDFLNTEEEKTEIANKKAAVQSAQTAPMVADAAASGAGAVKDIADASSTGTFDPNQLAQFMAKLGQAGSANRRAA